MIEKYLELFERAGMLKEVGRKGWKRIGVDDPESVADHSFRAAFMALVLGKELDVDGFKLIKLLLVHDLAESEVGDITPQDSVSKKEKFEKEENVIEELSRTFDSDLSLPELWKEYEQGDSREAIIARDIDRLEMVLQAVEYQKESPELEVTEFISNAEENMESEEIESLLEFLLENRPKDLS